jgi:hypothetical protein
MRRSGVCANSAAAPMSTQLSSAVIAVLPVWLSLFAQEW